MEIKKFSIETKKKRGIIDITQKVGGIVSDAGIKNGICNIFVAHTTASVATVDLDPGTDLDMLDAFEKLIPKLNYRHPHDPLHVPDHILSSIIGTSISVPIIGGALALGKWQRIVLIEFDGPRSRNIIISTF